MTNLFLTPAELRELTGFALKAKQIAQLRLMGIPFRVNGCGRPVVTVAAVQGLEQQPTKQAWQPSVLTVSRKAA
jgi:hypothetical protein